MQRPPNLAPKTDSPAPALARPNQGLSHTSQDGAPGSPPWRAREAGRATPRGGGEAMAALQTGSGLRMALAPRATLKRLRCVNAEARAGAARGQSASTATPAVAAAVSGCGGTSRRAPAPPRYSAAPLVRMERACAQRRARHAASGTPRRHRNGLTPQYFFTRAVTTRMKAMPSEMPTASAARVTRRSQRSVKQCVALSKGVAATAACEAADADARKMAARSAV